MGKGGALLGILGILLGVGGLGFGLINWMNTPVILHEPHWYSYNDTEFYPSPALEYKPITNISIVFELGRPMSLYLFFTCSARCHGNSSTYSDLLFYFMINDVRRTDMPWTRVGSYESNTNYEYYSVSLQHYLELMPAGAYNITVVVLTEQLGNFIRESSLWIRSSIA
ncbi:MAG: hypothetical protein ACXAAH_16940 [Promethearchaeota archaeon]|jgi:hypothetical protein